MLLLFVNGVKFLFQLGLILGEQVVELVLLCDAVSSLLSLLLLLHLHDLLVFWLDVRLAALFVLFFLHFLIAFAQKLLNALLSTDIGIFLRFLSLLFTLCSSSFFRVLQDLDLFLDSLFFTSSDRLVKQFLKDVNIVALANRDSFTSLAFDFNTCALQCLCSVIISSLFCKFLQSLFSSYFFLQGLFFL